jgi:hypothetical protein
MTVLIIDGVKCYLCGRLASYISTRYWVLFFLQVCFVYVSLVTHNITIMIKAKYRRVIPCVWD